MTTNTQDQSVCLSLIIPIFRSEASIPLLIKRLEKLRIFGEWEVIFVDDGSPDQSHSLLKDLLNVSSLRSLLVRHTRNFGEHQAVLTGYRLSKGEFVLNLDDDLQNPPEEGLRLWQFALENDLDVVYGDYGESQHSAWRNIGSYFAHLTAKILLEFPDRFSLSSFRCVKGSIAHQVAKYLGPYPYIDGLLSQLTQSIESIPVKHDKRHIGRSGYNLRRLIRLWLNIFTSFSLMPLRLSSILGILMSIAGIMGVCVVIVETLIMGITVSGWASIFSAILLFGGIQCLLIGLVGEYLGRIFLTVSGKPQSFIRSIYDKRS